MENTKQPAFTAEVRRAPMSQKAFDALTDGRINLAAEPPVTWEAGIASLSRIGYHITTWQDAEGKWTWTALDPNGATLSAAEPVEKEEDVYEKAILTVVSFATTPEEETGPLSEEDKKTNKKLAVAYRFLSDKLTKAETYEDVKSLHLKAYEIVHGDPQEEKQYADFNDSDIKADKEN